MFLAQVRHLLRGYCTREQHPALFVSTYEVSYKAQSHSILHNQQMVQQDLGCITIQALAHKLCHSAAKALLQLPAVQMAVLVPISRQHL
jgi:hypothetical protein